MTTTIATERKRLYLVREPARGVVRAHGEVEICVRFPPEMFESMRATAKREGRAFAEVVRTYCQWGVDAENGEASL